MQDFTAELASKIDEYIGGFRRKFEREVNDITFSTLKDQKKAFDCCSDCITKYIKGSDKTQAIQEIQDCIKKCQDPLETFQDRVNNELNVINENVINCQEKCFNQFEKLFKKPKDLLNVLSSDHALIKCYTQCFTDNYSALTEAKKRLINNS
ncbi:hypothetical protein OJ252_2705 [Cryptosporidium canis]|uniref:Uncharacterized protein n=1 Tax=Cryptosporidium canis TaxID=195482 RepID=A0ABQ8P4H9_9CRYT|nr:hypothetical protein OJ252_2705 [Cryptosporidium canis]